MATRRHSFRSVLLCPWARGVLHTVTLRGQPNIVCVLLALPSLEHQSFSKPDVGVSLLMCMLQVIQAEVEDRLRAGSTFQGERKGIRGYPFWCRCGCRGRSSASVGSWYSCCRSSAFAPPTGQTNSSRWAPLSILLSPSSLGPAGLSDLRNLVSSVTC